MSRRGTILVVDDESYVRESLVAVLTRAGFSVRTAKSAEDALSEGGLSGLDALVTDLKMPGQDGMALLEKVVSLEPELPVIVLTGHGTVPSAVEAMHSGAADYLLKPAQPEHLTLVVERAIGRAREHRELEYLRSESGAERRANEPIGESAEWREVVRLADLTAPTDTSVLLLGESGTGKEEIAKLVHRRSRRARAALVRVNCAAIPVELFESELFGHRKGAFTGAARDRDGRFRIADGGTLFLDEIDALPLPAQAKLLRVLQDGSFERVGDSRATEVDVRLICASNSDLPALVEEGAFRSDLFYRINVMTITLPPLRARPDDVVLLAEAFLEEFGARLGKRLEGLELETAEALAAYDWPGNVRELRNVVERGLLLESGERLSPSSLPFAAGGSATPLDAAADGLNLRAAVARAERRTLERALAEADGVKRRAAELLGVDERNLAYYLRKHGLMAPRKKS